MEKLQFFATLAICTFFLAAIQTASGQQAQFLSFWNTASCFGTAFANTTNSTTSITVPVNSTTLSYRANGLWEIQFCNTSTSCHTRFIQAGNGATCITDLVRVNYTRIHVHRYGDLDQNEARITFFERTLFTGPSYSATFGTPLDTTARLAGSYFFTGVNSWQHKPGQNSVGGVCLNSSVEVNQRGYGFTYSLGINAQVGWVRHGCNTTQPPLTTSTLRTTQRPTTTLRPTPTTPTNNTVRTTQTNGAGKLDNFAVMSLILMFMAMSFR
ncbi:uncharacterized protein LOC110855011 [Folsomia candida]|uniref:Uncharacterized protein n=1 Tax=Folsomia candida TaxID=158441 RepID=A0A226DUZ1_FOLCA|nr:uncharacterized protein LOC110855011 [Folsomia candida]OXA48511.1 hypothetical protein Fcan01_16320 [Folsomia candida]